MLGRGFCGRDFGIVRLGFGRFNLWRFHHRLNRRGLGRNRRNFRLDQRTPLSPNDGKQAVHDSNGVRADGDLFPVCAVRNGEARHGASAASRQVDDATRKFRRRDTSSDRRRDVGKCRRLDLFAAADAFKTARNKFAHNVNW